MASQRLLCLQCGTETEAAGPLDACPSCGSQHVPASLDDTVSITLTRHELRILAIWAANWARQDPAMGKCMRIILGRLGTQADAALSLGQEIAGLRAAFPESTVTVHRSDGTEAGL